jgi:hypothetical protein
MQGVNSEQPNHRKGGAPVQVEARILGLDQRELSFCLCQLLKPLRAETVKDSKSLDPEKLPFVVNIA